MAMKKLWLAAGAGALVIAGCASRPSPAPVAAPVAAATAAPVAIAAPLTAAVFMQVAASSALYSVRAADMADRRSRNPEVRRLAALQRSNGRGLAGQLSFAGRRVNLLPDATLSAQHQSLLNELALSRNFDATYLRQQKMMINQMHRIHYDFATRGRSPTLRPVAKLGAEMMAGQRRALDAID